MKTRSILLTAVCLLAFGAGAGGCQSSGRTPTAGEPLSQRDAEDLRSTVALAAYAAVKVVPERDQVRYASLARAIATDVQGIADGDATAGAVEAVTVDAVRDYVLGRISHANGAGGGSGDAVFLVDQLMGIVRRRLPVIDATTQPVGDALTRSAIRAAALGVIDGVAPFARSNP